MLLLAIETSSPVCSVALALDGKVCCTRESNAPNVHSTILTSFINELLQEASVDPTNLDAIAVSSGPGSYTGLRIGVATAKGLCFALDKPLIAVPTLQGMAYGMRDAYLSSKMTPTKLDNALTPDQNVNNALTPDQKVNNALTPDPSPRGRGEFYCPMLDARRMEVYCAVFSNQLDMVRETEAKIIDENVFSDLLSAGRVIFAGDGAQKCTPFLSMHPNATFLNEFRCDASFLVPLAIEKYHNQLFEDIAYFEPFYLKDFIAALPKVKGLKPTQNP